MRKKILVFSDSHGRCAFMQKIANKHADSLDYIFFLGDCLPDAYRLSVPDSVEIVAVAGNCDGAGGKERITDVLGKRFMLVHGDERTLDGYIRYAGSRGCDVLLYGHTHMPNCRYLGEGKPSYVFNPGTISGERTGKMTFGVIELDENNILLSFGKV